MQCSCSRSRSVDTVIVLKTDGPVKGRIGRLLQAQSTPNRLLEFDAKAYRKRIPSTATVKPLGTTSTAWRSRAISLQWDVRADRAQRFAVEVKYQYTATGQDRSGQVHH